MQGVKITVGVVVSDTSSGYVNKTNRGWGYYMANGKIGHAGPAKKIYAQRYSVGDIVTMGLVVDKRRDVVRINLHFIVL